MSPDVLSPTLSWPMVESSLGIIGACLPSVRPVFAGCSSLGFARKLRSISYFSSAPCEPHQDRVGKLIGTSNKGSTTTITHVISAKAYYPESSPHLYATKTICSKTLNVR